MIRRIITLALFVALVLSAPITRYNSMDQDSGSSPGGTACGHQTQYTMVGGSRGAMLIGFPVGDLSSSSSVKFFLKGASCVNADKINFNVMTMEDPSSTFTEIASGINNQCPFLTTKTSTVFTVSDSTCMNSGVDITDAFNAAKTANNAQLVLAFSNTLQQDSVNFCNRFLTPDAEPHFNDNNNCGLIANSHDINPSSFYIVVEQDGTPAPSSEATCAPCPCGSTSGKRRSGCPVCNVCSTDAPTTEPPVEATCAPCPCGSTSGKRRSGCPVCNVCSTEPPVEATCAPCPCGSTAGKRRSGCPVCNVCSSGAPTTAAPSTAAPTHPTDCWTCPAGMVHYWEIEGATADDKCACYPDPNAGAPASTTTTKAPTPSTTKASGENISGNNNARTSDSSKIVATGSVLLALVIAALL